MNNNSEILLINPPLWYYQSIPVDMIYAAYQLDVNMIQYDMRDLNLEALNYFLNKYDTDIPDILNANKYFFDINQLQECYRKMQNIFVSLSASIAPSKMGINYFDTKEDIRNLEDIETIAGNAENNPYIEFFEYIIPSLFKDNTKFIAFSLYHPDQLIPLITLCKIIKQQNSTIKIQVYGNLEDQVGTKILFEAMDCETKKKLSQYFDSISFGDAHSHMHEIYYDSIISDDKSEGNLKIYNYEDKNIFSISDSLLKRLPKSNFMPKDILNILSSTGCYWGRCNYCSIQSHSKYKKNTIKNTIDILRCANDSNEYSIVRFRDCCISPQDLEKIADHIIDEGMTVLWCCRARFENGFNKDIFAKLKKAGCIMISFGIESFHLVISKYMNKGIDVSRSYQIIKDCFESEIAVKLTAIYEYPKETYEQSIYNLQHLCEVSKYCVDIKVNKFLLFDNTYVADNPEKYGIRKIPYTKKQNLHFIYDYEKIDDNNNAVQRKEINGYVEKLEKSFECFISEEHLLLYLEMYGIHTCMKYIHGTNIIN